jgi:hypothetical protein
MTVTVKFNGCGGCAKDGTRDCTNQVKTMNLLSEAIEKVRVEVGLKECNIILEKST